MYSCKLFGNYPHNHKHTKDFQKIFPKLISSQVYLPAPKFSKRKIKSGLNNAYGKSKTDFVNTSASQINEL